MSAHKRFFGQLTGDFGAIIENEEAHHAINVMRIKTGDEIIVLDNTPYEHFATVIHADKKTITAKVINSRLSNAQSQTPITLICGFLKGDKTELVVQKAAELGVQSIVVFESTNSSAYLSDSKVQRLERVVKEAAKQCGRPMYPQIICEKTLAAALARAKDCENKFFAYELETAQALPVAALSGSIALVVGSEGGFTAAEAGLAKKSGFNIISLGRRILRAETAAIALTAVCAFAAGELKP